MSQNALLRSVKGLEIPGTARKEDKKIKFKVAVPVPADRHQDFERQEFERQEFERQEIDRRPSGPQQFVPQSSDYDPSDRKDHFATRNGVRCAGVHLIVDLHGAKRLDDIEHIEATLRHCVEASRATLLHIHLHHFQPNGVSGVAVLAESHISIHTWPDAGYAALDVFMCGSADPDACLPVLRAAFSPENIVVQDLLRGRQA